MEYVYILTCADGTLYTGWTNDLKKRLAAHNAGTGGKYTRSRLPVTLSYFEEYEDRTEAQKREYFIKHHLTREEKLALIAEKRGP
ncbi:MAG: GIY-YIG nuclease family protein [Lachnospiraceae bacterium]|nr:GIY-YIG nuclease family protein [Lachnospiraceae bacterium]